MIPQKPQDVTLNWIRKSIGGHPVFKGVRISGLSQEPLGEVEGFRATVARFSLSIDGSVPGVPETIILKLPFEDPKAGVPGEMYEREVLFYEGIAEEVPIRTPLCFPSKLFYLARGVAFAILDEVGTEEARFQRSIINERGYRLIPKDYDTLL